MDYLGVENLKPVPFMIRIKRVWFGNFRGYVEEDVEQGGMFGVGRVKGKIRGLNIAFVKRMPFFSMISEDGSLEYFDVPHTPILYEGTLNELTNEIIGTWLIEENTVKDGEGLLFMPKARGTFFMKKVETL